MSLPLPSTTASPSAARFQPVTVSFRETKRETPEILIREIGEALGVSPVLGQILLGRGISSVEEARAFLAPTLREHLPEPSAVKNIVQAADMLLDAIESRLLITVYSDFDVDGLSGGAQLYLFLTALGAAVNYYTPDRFTEGYGLVASAVEKLGQAGTELLVTVDCGVTSHGEIARARQLGMKTIVLDHHIPQGLPPADVVVDPAQDGCPFQEYKVAAAGLVWLLLIVLRRRAKERAFQAPQGEFPDPKDFLDLAALGTICDMVPLTKVNRLIAFRGSEALSLTQRPGLVALKEVAGLQKKKSINAGQVSFAIGPRINAAGRLDHAKKVVDLLTTNDTRKAKTLAETINKLNEKRRLVEEEVKQACLQQIHNRLSPEESAFALYGETFHLGVIGIAAQRIVEMYHRPSAVMGPGEAQVRGVTSKVIKGSVRSIPGFHVADGLEALRELLVAGGGHAEAGGFTLLPTNLERFQREFVDLAKRVLRPEHLLRHRVADASVRLREVTFEMAVELMRLAPFGVGNPAPLLVAHEVTIETVNVLGQGHLRLRLAQDGALLPGLAWKFYGHPLVQRGAKVSIAFTPEINSYQGISSLQLNLKEIWQPT